MKFSREAGKYPDPERLTFEQLLDLPRLRFPDAEAVPPENGEREQLLQLADSLPVFDRSLAEERMAHHAAADTMTFEELISHPRLRIPKLK